MTWDKAMTDILRFADLALGLLAGFLLTDKDPSEPSSATSGSAVAYSSPSSVRASSQVSCGRR